MRKEAQKNTTELGINNIQYMEGRAEEIPLYDNSVGVVAALTATMYPPEEVIPLFIDEGKRVVKPGGLIFSVDVAPGWYGGELASIIDDSEADIDESQYIAYLLMKTGSRLLMFIKPVTMVV